MTHAARTAALLAGALSVALAIPVIARDSGSNSWSRSGDVGKNPITKDTEQSFAFSATGRVDVRGIGGSVEVRVGESGQVALAHHRRAATQQDFDCETLEVEHAADELRIEVRNRQTRECREVRAEDTLVLRVPRGASLRLRSIGDSVRVVGVEGLVELESVGDAAVLEGVRQVDARSIGDALTLRLDALGERGVRVSSVGDSVELSLPNRLDANLRIEGVGDSIRGPGLRLDSPDSDYDLVLGKGGPEIRISSVGDSVRIKGPELRQPMRRRGD